MTRARSWPTPRLVLVLVKIR
eukprot:COSAG06_NODE_50389_length_319_cov_0.695455_1_plen_20_part_01